MTTLTSGLQNSNMVPLNQETRFLEVQFCEDSLQVWIEGLAGLEIFKALNAGTERSSKGNGTGTKPSISKAGMYVFDEEVYW